MRVLAITPTALSGDRLPALAPLATTSATRSGGTPARMPIAIPSGATSATLAMAPGPTVDTAQAATNRTMGTTRALPRARPTSRRASTATVPFSSASANSSVTPVSVTKSVVGKPARMPSAPSPAYRPTAQARGMAISPTFTREVKLMTIAAKRARSEAAAGLTRADPCSCEHGE